ncbi:hypothetical protein FOPG_17982, partial [Fusarium oxysporum f. sp. conglutinans race 2 54008]
MKRDKARGNTETVPNHYANLTARICVVRDHN